VFQVFYNVFTVAEEKRGGFPVIDKAGKAAVRLVFGAVRQIAGKFYQAFPVAVGVVP
jgi:hypothetical protein